MPQLRWRHVAFLGLLAVGCGDDEDAVVGPADGAALLTMGPYTVGYRVESVTYRPAGVAADRTLPLALWYPAATGTGGDTVYEVGGFLRVPRGGPRTGADLLAGRFPVIVYSHGYGGVGLAGFSYGEYFASWGFVVAAPDHTGNTSFDRSLSFAGNFLLRPQDLSATLDWLTGNAASPVRGHTTDDVAAIGHSFGGYSVVALTGARGNWASAQALCASDPGGCDVYADPAARAKLDAGFADRRFKAVVAQTPLILPYSPDGLTALGEPIMMVTARRDQTLPWDVHGGPGWALLHDPEDVWVDLSNSAHFSMIEICEIVAPSLLAVVGLDVAADGCGPDFTPILEIVPAVMGYAQAFIRLRVLGESRWRAVISGPPLHATATITVGH